LVEPQVVLVEQGLVMVQTVPQQAALAFPMVLLVVVVVKVLLMDLVATANQDW
jgi:hypothetical protein